MTPDSDDATVQPVPPEQTRPEDVDLPKVGRKEFARIARARERTRTRIAYGVLGTTGAVGLTGVVATLLGSENADTALTAYFSPLLGLAGAVVGWYFGGRESEL